MLYGFDQLTKAYTRLVDERSLLHAYLFFGEPQTGKFRFAQSLARYQEEGVFDVPNGQLREMIVISSDQEEGEGIGIGAVRSLSEFLYRKPSNAPYRVAIIRDAHELTQEAQNALLKILEEPPVRGVICATANDPDALLSTVSSRFLKIFVPILPEEQILDFLREYGKIPEKQCIDIARSAHGRIGRAIDMIESPSARQDASDEAKWAFKAVQGAHGSPDTIADHILAYTKKLPQNFSLFFEEFLSLFNEKNDALGNVRSAIVNTIVVCNTLSVNKRIHLKHLLWTIKSSLRPS